ncbi:hypothetical protein [Pseudoroseomonas sp. WGS1072]|uniref:hypothetical protein n=1 Tax=Roseomonas sp. WGS1072 TaxID=3366816 RepID=UPI003BF36547
MSNTMMFGNFSLAARSRIDATAQLLHETHDRGRTAAKDQLAGMQSQDLVAEARRYNEVVNHEHDADATLLVETLDGNAC